MKASAVLNPILKILTLTLTFFSCVQVCSSNENDRLVENERLRQWEIIDLRKAVYVLKISPTYMMTHLDGLKRFFSNILISIDLKEPKATTDHVIDCLTQVALRNEQNSRPWEFWLSLTPRGDISMELDFITNITTSVNRISNGMITAILLNYGLLQLTPITSPVVKDDLKACNNKLYTRNLKCGLLIDSFNCLTSLDHINNLELKPGNIFIPSDDHYSYHAKGKTMMLHTVRPCLWSLKYANVSLGYKMDYVFNNEFNETKRNASHHRKRRSTLGEEEFHLKIDYIVADHTTGPAGPGNRRKFKPVDAEWLRRSTEFDKSLVGISVHTSDNFLFHQKSALTRLLQQFSTILIEVDDIEVGNDLVIKMTKSTKDSAAGSPPKFGLVMSIFYQDFELNKERLNRFLSIATTGNDEYPGSIKLILFNWALPLRNKQGLSTYQLNESFTAFVDRHLTQAKALNKILKYVDTQNITKVQFGVVWETTALNRLLQNKTQSDMVFYHMHLHPLYLNWFILKTTISMSFILDDLLYATRTTIYSLSAHIDVIRGSPLKEASFPVNVWVYIGIEGCPGRSHNNISELTEYVLFWEIIQNWAASKNVTVIMNTAFEKEQTQKGRKDCEREYMMTGWTSCMCGWWLVPNNSVTSSEEDSNQWGAIENKKSRAHRLQAQKEVPKTTETKEDGRATIRLNKTKLYSIVISAVIFCILLGCFTFYGVRYYRFKDLISQREFQQFLLGSRESNTGYLGNEGNVNAQGNAYDRERYEILKNLFAIDFGSHLGQGEFGTVYKGVITRADTKLDVAVKMKIGKISNQNQRHGNILAVRSIISEIKILSYVGDHPNIVKLEGAYTAKLRKGTAMVFLELCAMGSLDKHLRTYNPESIITSELPEGVAETSFVNRGIIESGDDHIENEERLLSGELRKNLAKWAHEIAGGMEFLTTKRVNSLK